MPTSKIIELSYNDLVNIHSLVERTFGISAGVRDPSLVDAVANRPTQMFYGSVPFPDIFTKAASIMEAINRWQPFVDANKRTALATISAYLAVNGYSFTLPLSAVRFSVEVALAKTKDENGHEVQEKITQLVNEIAKWLRKYSGRTNSLSARLKPYIYLNIPILTLEFLFRLGFKGFVSEIAGKWFALDIYPEYAKEAENMIGFLLRLTSANLKPIQRRNHQG